jgi:dCMP deaminase
MKEKFVKLYMDFAARVSKLSYARRLQVGAIVVKDDRVISIGYNGMPAGWDNNCEDVEWCSAGGWLSPEEIEEMWPYEGEYKDRDGVTMKGRYRLVTKPEVLHAERNALDKLAKGTEGGDGSSMFITHSPCLECAKSIKGAGIKRVYFGVQYRDDSGIRFLKNSGIEVTLIQ